MTMGHARRGAATLAMLVALVAAASASAAESRPHPLNFFEVAIEDPGLTDPVFGLPDHTVFRPADLDSVGFRLPIVVWGNGGCRRSNQEFHYFLTQFASYGYLVVANGAPATPYIAAEVDGLLAPDGDKLVRAIDWAIAQNASPTSPLRDRLDTSRIVAMGQSCGATEAAEASADERVTSTILWNGTCNGAGALAASTDPDCLKKLHAPTLWATGGPDDLVYSTVESDVPKTSVPGVWADNPSVGHTGMWDDNQVNGGAVVESKGAGGAYVSGAAPSTYQNEPLLMGWRWLEHTLYGDAESRRFFYGPQCGLCARGTWTVKTRR
jgi:dienelactone hydrolase